MSLLLNDYIARRLTPNCLRFYGMGFKIAFAYEEEPDYSSVIMVTVGFVCVCGREERLRVHGTPRSFELSNFYDDLARHESLTRAHLLKDGYSPEQVDEMEERCREYMARHGVHVPRPVRVEAWP